MGFLLCPILITHFKWKYVGCLCIIYKWEIDILFLKTRVKDYDQHIPRTFQWLRRKRKCHQVKVYLCTNTDVSVWHLFSFGKALGCVCEEAGEQIQEKANHDIHQQKRGTICMRLRSSRELSCCRIYKANSTNECHTEKKNRDSETWLLNFLWQLMSLEDSHSRALRVQSAYHKVCLTKFDWWWRNLNWL